MCNVVYDLSELIACDAIEFNWWVAELITSKILALGSKNEERIFDDDSVICFVQEDILKYSSNNPYGIQEYEIDKIVDSIIVLTYKKAYPIIMTQALANKYNLA